MCKTCIEQRLSREKVLNPTVANLSRKIFRQIIRFQLDGILRSFCAKVIGFLATRINEMLETCSAVGGFSMSCEMLCHRCFENICHSALTNFLIEKSYGSLGVPERSKVVLLADARQEMFCQLRQVDAALHNQKIV